MTANITFLLVSFRCDDIKQIVSIHMHASLFFDAIYNLFFTLKACVSKIDVLMAVEDQLEATGSYREN